MTINELENNANLHIKARIGTNVLEFDTSVYVAEDKNEKKIIDQLLHKLRVPTVVVKAIEKDGKTVGFPMTGVVYEIFGIKDEKPYLWNQATIKLIKIPGGEKYHVISSRQNPNVHNRREAFRLWLGTDSIIQVGSNRKTDDAIVKDISASGFSLIVSTEVKGDVGSLVHVTFNDNETGTRFKLSGLIVRIEEVDEGRKLYGCRLNAEVSALSQFINKKQRERMQLEARNR